jgi:segregation and condensation protein B
VNPEILAALEAVLFASDAPLELGRIAEVLELDVETARAAVAELSAACESPARGLAVVEVGGGVRLVTRPELAPALLRLQRLRLKTRLSRAALETLAIVAYRQPISRPEIEQLRGVSADAVVTHLLDRRLIRVVGRKPGPGRPILYGTTRDFLEHFGLRDVGELPPFEIPAEAAEAAAAAGPPAEPAHPGGAGDDAEAGEAEAPAPEAEPLAAGAGRDDEGGTV